MARPGPETIVPLPALAVISTAAALRGAFDEGAPSNGFDMTIEAATAVVSERKTRYPARRCIVLSFQFRTEVVKYECTPF